MEGKWILRSSNNVLKMLIFLLFSTFKSSESFLSNHNLKTFSSCKTKVPTMVLQDFSPAVLQDIASTSLLSFTKVDPDQARANFYFFFFAGSGALGIGFAQVPKLIAEYRKVQSLGGGQSKGGKNFDCSPLATIGYPEQMKEADVQYVIDNIPSMEKIVASGEKKTYFAQLGYVQRDSFYNSLPKANPLVLYAAFDAIVQGGGAYANPDEAEATVQKWREEGVESFAASLLSATVRKYSAYIVFAFLIGLVLDLIAESGINAFL